MFISTISPPRKFCNKLNLFKKLYLKIKLNNLKKDEINDQTDLNNKLALEKIISSHPQTEDRIKMLEIKSQEAKKIAATT